MLIMAVMMIMLKTKKMIVIILVCIANSFNGENKVGCDSNNDGT